MKFGNKILGGEFYSEPSDRTAGATLRLLGIDLDVAVYGFINDWYFPLMFVPSTCGIFLQILGLSLFIGRVPNGAKHDPLPAR
jgi:hypothetical protein